MAERQSGGATPWVAFLAGVILVAIVGLGIFAYSGGLSSQHTADLKINMPDVNIPPPDVDLPEPPPAPSLPPSAEGTATP